MTTGLENVNFSDPKNLIAAALLPVLLAGAVFWYFVKPVSEQRDRQEAQVTALHSQNLHNRAFELQRAQYVKRIADLGVQLAALQATVPEESDADGLIRTINETAKRRGIYIRSLVAQPQVARELYTEVPFKLRLDGTYYGVLSFFDELAHEPRIINITALGLGPPTRGGLGAYTVDHGETVGVNCVATTFFSHPEAAPAPAKPAVVKK
jgi:type IV pilus assembly protein PilO